MPQRVGRVLKLAIRSVILAFHSRSLVVVIACLVRKAPYSTNARAPVLNTGSGFC